jgi:hypothetical protein
MLDLFFKQSVRTHIGLSKYAHGKGDNIFISYGKCRVNAWLASIHYITLLFIPLRKASEVPSIS